MKFALIDIGMDKEAPRPFRINIERIFQDQEQEQERTICWVEPHPLKNVYVLGHHNPADFGWLIPEKT